MLIHDLMQQSRLCAVIERCDSPNAIGCGWSAAPDAQRICAVEPAIARVKASSRVAARWRSRPRWHRSRQLPPVACMQVCAPRGGVCVCVEGRPAAKWVIIRISALGYSRQDSVKKHTCIGLTTSFLDQILCQGLENAHRRWRPRRLWHVGDSSHRTWARGLGGAARPRFPKPYAAPRQLVACTRTIVVNFVLLLW